MRMQQRIVIWGCSGGLEKIQDQSQWDGQGSPLRAVEKSGTPYQTHWLILTLIDLQTDSVCVCVCVHVHWVPWKSSLQAKKASQLK